MGALSNERVFTELFDLNDEREIGHIRLSREADLIVVAPATADLLAKMAGGHADDLASCVLMATDKPVLVAPAMNPRMWLHPATRRNVALLQVDGIHFIGPNTGEMAERGEAGPGRMSEVPELVEAIGGLLASPSALVGEGRGRGESQRSWNPPAPSPSPQGGGEYGRGNGPLAGRHVLVTSGPTHEPIDPVRYIANRSSGKQGAAIAAEAAALGARVTLVSGPTQVAPPAGVEIVNVETAREMLDAVRAALPADIAIFAAAVADWRVASQSSEKIKKGGKGVPSLDLVENPDILKTIASDRPGRRPPLVIGFAAETRERRRAREKEAQGQGCGLDRRQRCLARDRHHGRRPQHRAPDHGAGRRELARARQGAGCATPRGPCCGMAHRKHRRDMTRKPAKPALRIKVVRLSHGRDLSLPTYQSEGAAGMDLSGRRRASP